MHSQAIYPTKEHELSAETVVRFFSQQDEVEAVILMGSCARGKASSDSCLDFLILVSSEILATRRQEMEHRWEEFYEQADVFKALIQVGAYSHVDLDFIDGQFPQPYHGWCSGPDEFELGIGNTFAYTVALWERGKTFQNLKSQWLPYYGENLRQERLAMVRKYCLNNLDHIPLYVDRGLYFQSFNRLYHAFGEFLQALFISHRIYPIAYDKWIREQIEEILELPELYQKLLKLLEVSDFESQELTYKACELEELLTQYVV